jgi:transcriptional regulator GlxA family with amidase domain
VLRHHFSRRLGTTPKDYRRTFCGTSDAARAPVAATA